MNTMDTRSNLLLFCVVCLSRVLQTTQTTTVAPPECLSAALADGLSEWQDQLATSYVSVEWGYGNITCSSMNGCFGQNLYKDVLLEPQIHPLQIQTGVNVRFFASPHMDVRFSLMAYHVDEFGFRSCDSARGQQVTDTPMPDEFVVDTKFLSLGSNYFIANTTDLLYECRFGLRLNVTVKTSDCRPSDGAATCSGRGRCVTNAIQPLYECACCHGYTGHYCEEDDACARYPCQNGGTCADVIEDKTGTYFTCTCPLGFYGDTCDKHVNNMCDVSPCDNNATCSGNHSNYTCLCPAGFSGYHCEVNINNCEVNPCVHGVCVDDLGTHTCYCTPGYGGLNCEHEFNECQSNPCKNGGFCIDLQDGFRCQCNRGYTGQDCSVKMDLCNPSPCQNATECVDYGHDFACTCRPGFTGIHCEININECASSPCLNNGRCRDIVAGYRCLCDDGISGVHCEYRRLDLPRVKPQIMAQDSSDRSPLHIDHLYIVAGTLAGALLIALVVLTGCYCKVHETYRKLYCKRPGYDRQHNDSLRLKRETSARQMARHLPDAGPSMDAILDVTAVGYDDNSLDTPLVNSLRPKIV